MAILETKGITKKFGALIALDNLDISINDGEIVGLVGPNGSGKTTWINVVTGFLKPTAGSVTYKSQSITGLEPHKIAALGLVRTFQLTSLFPNLTVRENLTAATYLKNKYGLIGSYFRSIFNTRSYRNEEKRLVEKSNEILAFLEMGGKADTIAGNLPSVDQRKLEIAIALAVEPSLLLLDEPAAGMNPKEIDRLLPWIQSINKSGISLLVIEHNMKVIMGICTRVVVLNHGTKICDGTCDEVINDPKVISSYLGKEL